MVGSREAGFLEAAASELRLGKGVEIKEMKKHAEEKTRAKS